MAIQNWDTRITWMKLLASPFSNCTGARSNQKEVANCNKLSIWCENEKSEYWKRFFIFIFTFHSCQILCIISFQRLVFSHRQLPFHLLLLHADRFTLRHALLLFLNASAVLWMKREITWLWREIVPACMVYFTAPLFDSVSTHLTFFCPNLPCIENLLNGKVNKFKYVGAALFNFNKMERIAVFVVLCCFISIRTFTF